MFRGTGSMIWHTSKSCSRYISRKGYLEKDLSYANAYPIITRIQAQRTHDSGTNKEWQITCTSNLTTFGDLVTPSFSMMVASSPK